MREDRIEVKQAEPIAPVLCAIELTDELSDEALDREQGGYCVMACAPRRVYT